jgi:hypothetical protein
LSRLEVLDYRCRVKEDELAKLSDRYDAREAELAASSKKRKGNGPVTRYEADKPKPASGSEASKNGFASYWTGRGSQKTMPRAVDSFLRVLSGAEDKLSKLLRSALKQ